MGKGTSDTLMETGCAEELLRELGDLGYQGRVVAIEHVRELKEDIGQLRELGLIDEEFYLERLCGFSFRVPEALPDAGSIIVIAVPRPQSQSIFTWKGKKTALVIPPTYVGYRQTTKMVEEIVSRFLGPRGYRIASTALPLKLLAVRSGLGQYGRNNICYVPGMGSFLQLVAIYSDMPCQKDGWREARMMDRCLNCHACLKGCPTGAIPSDRFLLHAEKCIVFHNERKAGIAFPAWMDPSWHNCLEGCLLCQKVCPENRGLLQWIEGTEEFTQEETELLLGGVTRDQLPAATARKLEHLDLIDDLAILPRNIGVFFGEDS